MVSGQYGPFDIKVIEDLHFENGIKLAFVITEEDLIAKQEVISFLESRLPEDAVIAINSETIPLDAIQDNLAKPGRILIANWVEPVHTTFFLEIVANEVTEARFVDQITDLARSYWGKDPYVIQGDTGVRMRLLAALMREAFYLVKNDYATIEDIDRACRNDAGYYLPFAGNLRYMDLMGTYSYGMVMKDLNPELAKDQTAPDFFNALIREGDFGMESGKGFYAYQPGEDEKWEALVKKFSSEIHEVIDKYPFNQ